MYSSCKRSIRRNTTWSTIYVSLQRNIPKFDSLTWLKLEQLTTKILKQNSNRRKRIKLWAKTWKISGISDAISPARHPQKSSQHVRVCAAGDGAICSKNRIIVPYHGDNPNTRNGARLRSRSPIMAPAQTQFVDTIFELLIFENWLWASVYLAAKKLFFGVDFCCWL